MKGRVLVQRRSRVKRTVFACSVTMAMLVASLVSVGVLSSTADARGPIYSGPITQSTGPAYFGPAPNPYPYCDNPTYFDPFPDNGTVDGSGNIVAQPRGSMNVGDFSEVTTDGNTMRLTIDAEGTFEPVYPGFFPDALGNGAPNDQPKGVEMASGDEATVTLTSPLFYSQWVFTDVDRENEGFFVTPNWLGSPGQIFIIGGDDEFTLDDTTTTTAHFNDTNTVAQDSQDIEARVQVDFLGAVNQIKLVRDDGFGQSGFAVGGGCRAAGAAKVLVDGPTWNGTSFDVTYELRVRNNLPSTSTLAAAIVSAQADAQANNREFFLTGQPSGIPLQNLQLEDDLTDPSFSQIAVVDVSTDTSNDLVLNATYDGVGDIQLLDPGSAIDAETDEVITLEVQYTPDLSDPKWSNCRAPVDYLNQSVVRGTASAVAVVDLSDDGIDPAPNSDNGFGGVDDPTPVSFPCPPADLEIVKTAVPGPAGTCPATFDDGVLGNGTPLVITANDIVTYCISVRNPGSTTATNVVVTDSLLPGASYPLPDLAGGAQNNSISYDLQFGPTQPVAQTVTNVATVNGSGPAGPLSDSDPAVVRVNPLNPSIEIVKTVLPGPNAQCPLFDDGNPNTGPPLQLLSGATATYCISVRNNGDTAVNDVVVSDPQANGVQFDGSVGDLAIGAEGTVSFDLVVDVNTPNINTATAVGDGPYGQVGPVQEKAHIVVTPTNPTIEIVKTVVTGPNGTCPSFAAGVPGPGPALPAPIGSTVTYCISVRNIGNGTATGVTITDDQSPDSPWTLPDLAPGAEDSVSFDLVVTESTEDVNVACAEVDQVSGLVCDEARIEKTTPELRIVKTAVTGPNGACPTFEAGTAGVGAPIVAPIGSTVTYCISVRNVGDAVATNVTIADVQSPQSPYSIGDLAPGATDTVSYDLVIGETSPPALNTACAAADEDIAQVCDDSLIERPDDPELEIVKTVVPGPSGECPAFDDGVPGPGVPLAVEIGDTVTYCIAIRNSGDGDADNVQITDDQMPGSPFEVGGLASGAESGTAYDLVVDANTKLINVAVVTGTGPNGPVDQADDDAVISVGNQASISLIHSVERAEEVCKTVAKDLNSLVADVPGTRVTWCAKITNTGSVPLTDIVFNASAIGQNDVDPLAVQQLGTVLLPGDSITITVGGDSIPAAGLTSPATVTAEPSDQQGNLLPDVGPVSDDDDAEVREASIDLQTTVVEGHDGDCATSVEEVTVDIGADITWCFTVTNTGTIDLLVTEVADVTLGITVPIPAGSQVLEPGETVVVQINSTATTALVNDAEVEGQPLDLDGSVLDQAPVVEDADPASVKVREADLGIDKTVSDEGPVPTGTRLTYTLVVTNNGPDTARGVSVSDDLPAGLSYVALPGDADWSCSLGSGEQTFTCLKATPMDNGDSVTLTYTVDVDDDAARPASFTNTSTVTSRTRDTDLSNNTDTATTSTPRPDEVLPRPPVTPAPEYPGPFTPPPAPTAPAPDEVLGLAITGSSSNLLGLFSAVMLSIGGLLMVGARRSRRDDY